MLGLFIGAALGCAALYCLSLFSAAITGGDVQKAVLPLLGNIAALGLGLAIPAIFLRDQLAQAGIGLAGVLVVGSIGLFAWRAYRR